MKTKPDVYILKSLEGLQEKIESQSDYQRPEVWKRAQKQLLIDSILRGYDIPKIYAKKVENNPKCHLEIIDGQQRLAAIWQFFNNDFALPKDAEPINGIDCSSQTYDELDMELRQHFDEYSVNFVIVTEARQDAEKDEIGDLFLRLQNGTPLNYQEKRNAMPGNMRAFVKKIGKHDFFESCAFSNIRYAYDQMAAQLICLELSLETSNRLTNVSTGDLDKMYKKENNFDVNSKVAKQVTKVLDYLHRAFPNKEPELVKHSVINLYCLVSKLIKFYSCDGYEEKLKKWFNDFEEERRENDEKEEIDKNPSLSEYKRCAGNSSDKQPQIEKRFAILQEWFFLAVPDILPKDENRAFSHKQRIEIFRRDEAKCQICGKNLEWDDFDADHIIPHSKGGETINANAQATCKSCNRSKSNRL